MSVSEAAPDELRKEEREGSGKEKGSPHRRTDFSPLPCCIVTTWLFHHCFEVPARSISACSSRKKRKSWTHKVNEQVGEDAALANAITIVVGHACCSSAYCTSVPNVQAAERETGRRGGESERRTLPRDDAGQALWLARRHSPLRPTIVRDAEETDLARREVLSGGPLDALGEVARRAGAHRVEEARGGADAALVDAHDDVALRDPILRAR